MAEFQPVIGRVIGWVYETSQERQAAIRILRERIRRKHESERVIVPELPYKPLDLRIRRHIQQSRAELVLQLTDLEQSSLRFAPALFGHPLWDVT